MTRSDLRARPIFAYQRKAIEAHLAVVLVFQAIARHLHNASGMPIKKIVRTSRHLRSMTIGIGKEQLTAAP